MKINKVKWSQTNNVVYLHINDAKFYFTAPPGYKISETSPHLKELALYHLLWNMDYFKKKDGVELPSHMHNDTKIPLKGNKIGLSYSNGKDSAAVLACLPEDETIPIYLERDLSTPSSRNVIQKIMARKKNSVINMNSIPIARKYNASALKLMKLAKIKNLKIFKTDFELIRCYVLNENISIGYHCGFGYAAILILLSEFYDLGYLTFGTVFDTIYIQGNPKFPIKFLDIGDKSRTSQFQLRCKIYEAYGLKFFYALGGCSEQVTNIIVNKSKFAKTASSCQMPMIGNNNHCKKCIKCFRNAKIKKENVEKNKTIKQKLYKFPLRPATSTLYAARKVGYSNPLIKKYSHLNISFVTKYYPQYLEPESDTHKELVPDRFRDFIKNKLKSFGVPPMNEEDLKNLHKYLIN